MAINRRLVMVVVCCCTLLGPLFVAAQYSILSFRNLKGLILVDADVEGRTYTFLVDSGTSETVISKNIAQKLGFRWRKKQRVRDSNQRTATVERLRLRDMQLGSFRLRNRYARVVDLKARNGLGRLGIDGIIGVDVMQQFHWRIDFPKQRIHLFRSGQFLPKTAAWVPLIQAKGARMHLSVTLGQGRSQRFLLDLGYNGELELGQHTLEQLATDQNLLVMRGYTTGSTGLLGQGTPERMVVVNLPGVQLGPRAMGSVLARGRAGALAKVGTRLFEQQCITLDWKNRRMYIESSLPNG